MRLVKSITLRILLMILGTQLVAYGLLNAQDNSPYSRYGLGDITPNTNIVNRGMGGFSAAYADPFSVNFSNPASYSAFLAYLEERSKKYASGRVLLDAALNFTNHTLREGSSPQKFTSSDALFSYLQVGVPLRKNWGFNFGLRQLTRIGYKVNDVERLYDPLTGQSIDSAVTQYEGDGGAFLGSLGTGFAIKNLSIGLNFGYLFGKKVYSTKRAFINDSVEYNSSSYNTQTSFGNIYGTAGVQYKIDLNSKLLLRLGVYGNLKQNIGATQDIKRQTVVGSQAGDIQLDSIYGKKDVKGTIIYPASFGTGFVIEKKIDPKNNKYGNWLFGLDFVQSNWKDYRFYGEQDSVQNSWLLKMGGEVRPEPKHNYFSNVTYRAGLVLGQDYIHVVEKLPIWGLSFGLGLPLANYNQLARTQASIINLALEFTKRGNNKNSLKDNYLRLSVGFSFSDLWFIKRKYE
jgi:hypothetical protein